jgi:uncharacterized protein YjlB
MKIRVKRNPIGKILAALGLSQSARPSAVPDSQSSLSDPTPELLLLSRNGWVPNNEHLPVLIYRGVIETLPGKRIVMVEDSFRSNWWMPQSRNSIYDFHHYHSTAHEAMGVATGEARVVLGGEGGAEVTLQAGDVVVLPTGTGHCKIDASPDFVVVGAYCPDVDWDICRRAPTTEAIERMRSMQIPTFDPVTGIEGSLTKLWSKPGPRLKSVSMAS